MAILPKKTGFVWLGLGGFTHTSEWRRVWVTRANRPARWAGSGSWTLLSVDAPRRVDDSTEQPVRDAAFQLEDVECRSSPPPRWATDACDEMLGQSRGLELQEYPVLSSRDREKIDL